MPSNDASGSSSNNPSGTSSSNDPSSARSNDASTASTNDPAGTRSNDAAVASPDSRFAALPARPGKIIAVHLSYASRATQRGRRPSAPSYFFKPSSSVQASGGEIVRPQGTELLAFEGEIALVIGTDARWVSLESAWNHVAWVTAANDFGLYDLRANDKGSNVRSKGGDGFTPIGPTLIDARTIDPAALRLRTWVNGDVVQDATTDDLLFPLPQFVADLSQHFTLEAGDVILTGTPAGSSVVQPGDVVEVEVDAPGENGHPSSGRLVTTVVQGTRSFDAAVGSLPAVDDTQRAEAWGSLEAAGLDPEGRDSAVPAVAPASAEAVADGLESTDGSDHRPGGLEATDATDRAIDRPVDRTIDRPVDGARDLGPDGVAARGADR